MCDEEDKSESEEITKGIKKLKQKISRGYFSHKEPKVDSGFAKIKESLITQKKGRRRPALTTAEKTEIVYQAVVKMKLVKEIAKKHRVSVATVTMLVSKAKRKPHFIEELYARDENREEKFKRVEAVVKEMTKNNEFIDSCEFVMNRVNNKDDSE